MLIVNEIIGFLNAKEDQCAAQAVMIGKLRAQLAVAREACEKLNGKNEELRKDNDQFRQLNSDCTKLAKENLRINDELIELQKQQQDTPDGEKVVGLQRQVGALTKSLEAMTNDRDMYFIDWVAAEKELRDVKGKLEEKDKKLHKALVTVKLLADLFPDHRDDAEAYEKFMFSMLKMSSRGIIIQARGMVAPERADD